MNATHYQGSKGPVEIAKMAYPHLKSAHDKLIRDGFAKQRAPELSALAARIEALDAEHAAAQAARVQS